MTKIIIIDDQRFIGCPVTQQLLAVPADWQGDDQAPTIWPPFLYAATGQKAAMYVAGGNVYFVANSAIAPGEVTPLPDPDPAWPVAPAWVEPEPEPPADDGGSETQGPKPLSPVQFEAAMRLLGITYGEIEAEIDRVLANPAENAVAKARLHRSAVYRRDNPLFDMLGPLLGKTPEALDFAWAMASEIP